MSSKITKILASLLALAALALGGSAIASAMNDNPSSDQSSQEQTSGATENESGPEGADDDATENESGPEGADDGTETGAQGADDGAPDPGEAVSTEVNTKVSAAAEKATGGSVEEVTKETSDAPEKGDAADPGEKASPAGTAYEADVTKGSKELKVSLDDQFKVLQVETEIAD